MTENTPRICPVCGRAYTERPALSRRDNKTDMCPDCGMREALEALDAFQEQTAASERSTSC